MVLARGSGRARRRGLAPLTGSRLACFGRKLLLLLFLFLLLLLLFVEKLLLLVGSRLLKSRRCWMTFFRERTVRLDEATWGCGSASSRSAGQRRERLQGVQGRVGKMPMGIGT